VLPKCEGTRLAPIDPPTSDPQHRYVLAGPLQLSRLLATCANHLETGNGYLASPTFRFFPFFALHGTGHGDGVANVILESYGAAGQFVFLAALADCEFVFLITFLQTAGDRDCLAFRLFSLFLPGRPEKLNRVETRNTARK